MIAMPISEADDSKQAELISHTEIWKHSGRFQHSYNWDLIKCIVGSRDLDKHPIKCIILKYHDLKYCNIFKIWCIELLMGPVIVYVVDYTIIWLWFKVLQLDCNKFETSCLHWHSALGFCGLMIRNEFMYFMAQKCFRRCTHLINNIW